jgi:hypothetical protein
MGNRYRNGRARRRIGERGARPYTVKPMNATQTHFWFLRRLARGDRPYVLSPYFAMIEGSDYLAMLEGSAYLARLRVMLRETDEAGANVAVAQLTAGASPRPTAEQVAADRGANRARTTEPL